jgi:hypothetical protein
LEEGRVAGLRFVAEGIEEELRGTVVLTSGGGAPAPKRWGRESFENPVKNVGIIWYIYSIYI